MPAQIVPLPSSVDVREIPKPSWWNKPDTELPTQNDFDAHAHKRNWLKPALLGTAAGAVGVGAAAAAISHLADGARGAQVLRHGVGWGGAGAVAGAIFGGAILADIITTDAGRSEFDNLYPRDRFTRVPVASRKD